MATRCEDVGVGGADLETIAKLLRAAADVAEALDYGGELATWNALAAFRAAEEKL